MRAVVLSVAGLLFLAGSAFAQTQNGAAPSPGPSLKATSQEVVLDMTFRTKKGKPVQDVRPEEIHVYENGTEQKLKSFRLIEANAPSGGPAPAAPATAAAASPAVDPMREIRLVALVIEGVTDPDSKRFYRQAAKDLLAMAPEQNLYFGLFASDAALYCIQPFTADRDALMKAVERSLAWNSYIQYNPQSSQVTQQLASIVNQGPPVLQGGPTGSPNTAAFVNYQLAAMQYHMLQSSAAGDRELNEFATLDALRTLVRELSQLPGRKVIIYFNPWFTVGNNIKERYDNLLSLANRGNITFNTVDTKGLTSWDQSSTGKSMLDDANSQARMQGQNGGVGIISTDQVKSQDTAISAQRSNPMEWLRNLAVSTGGTLVGDSNDWKAPLKIAMDEVQTYYEATYTPTIETWDGRFRKLNVKVDRSDVQVHTRNGYYALPLLRGGQEVASYELPLLNAINAPAPPGDLEFHSAAERFNDRGPKVEYMVTVEAPLKNLTFQPHAEQKKASVDAGLLAVVKDQQGEIVEKFSKDFAVQVDLDKVDGYKQGNMVQTFHTSLAPGDYTLETAVMDRNGAKTGVEKTPLHVPAASSKLSMSDVVIVRRAEPLKDNQILDAFYYQGGKIIPTLSDKLKGGPGNVLSFYFAVYRDPSVHDEPKLTMAFSKDGQYLGAAQAPLPPPEKDGRIPYIASLPADKFVPGLWEIKVGIEQGSEKTEQKVDFHIE